MPIVKAYDCNTLARTSSLYSIMGEARPMIALSSIIHEGNQNRSLSARNSIICFPCPDLLGDKYCDTLSPRINVAAAVLIRTASHKGLEK